MVIKDELLVKIVWLKVIDLVEEEKEDGLLRGHNDCAAVHCQRLSNEHWT